MSSLTKPNLTKRRRLGLAVIAAAAALLTLFTSSPAFASLTLVQDYAIQQTSNDPCVIGNSSCGPAASSTLIYWQQKNSPGPTYVLYSPNYTAGSTYWGTNRNIIPLAFSLGIDENLATSAGDEQLLYWDTFVCTSSCGSNTTGGLLPSTTSSGYTTLSNFSLDTPNSYTTPTSIDNYKNGNGYSDAILKGFSLTAGDTYYFMVGWGNDTDGVEQFFIIPGVTPPPNVPEPGSLGIFGAGLVGMGLLGFFANRRRANRRGRVL